MWKYKVVYSIILAAMIVVYIWTNGKQALVFLIFWIVGFLLFKITGWLGSQNVKLVLEVPQACKTDQLTHLIIRVHRDRAFPIGRISMDFIYDNKLFQRRETKRIYLVCGNTKDIDFKIPLPENNCGKHEIYLENVCCYDAIGLTKVKVKAKDYKELTLYPKDMSIHTQFSNRIDSRVFGEVYNKISKGMDVNEIFALREYQEGDSMHRIHWKLSSKLDDLIVREFGKSTSYEILVLFDTVFVKQGVQIEDSIINGIFSAASSISYNLMQQGIGHHIGIIQQEQLVENCIENSSDYLTTLQDMMNVHLLNEEQNTVDIFLQGDYYKQFTKIIYVTGNFKEEQAQVLAQFVNLTVIVLQNMLTDSINASQGYNIVSINTENPEQQKYYIDI